MRLVPSRWYTYVLFCFVGIAVLLAEARKAAFFQHVTDMHKPPVHARSSYRTVVNSTAGHDWPFVTLSAEFGVPLAMSVPPDTSSGGHNAESRKRRQPIEG